MNMDQYISEYFHSVYKNCCPETRKTAYTEAWIRIINRFEMSRTPESYKQIIGISEQSKRGERVNRI